MCLRKTSRCGALIAVAVISSLVSARAETLVALMTDKKLRYFNSTSPNAWLKTIDITGIPGTESVQALDFRVDATLAVITREGGTLRGYSVNTTTGAAQALYFFSTPSANAVAFDIMTPSIYGTYFTALTEADVMYRFSYGPTGGGGTQADLPVVYDNNSSDGDPTDEHIGANPNIVALGSTNGFVGAKSNVLYGIDATQNSLVKINRSTGFIDTVGALRTSGGANVDVDTRTGFDISAVTGTAYLAFGLGAPTSLYTVDLESGLTILQGTIGPAAQPAGILVVDIATLPESEVANLSTRSRVGTGEEAMIAGFTVQGGSTNRVLIRALGPSLTAFGINNALADPELTIFDGNGVPIGFNSSWKSHQQDDIFQTGLAPGSDYEPAYLSEFQPGQYTAIVSGYNGQTGVGLVEVYKLRDL
ncbi:MAG TPA: DUF4394 domain-containing protein [Chthoniobacterales bacterium]|jgi:hypothetical protein|nr:DUF4394 domain-containing protein [Chthoniobacterales bacterium]